ncbi:hypothetical protein C8Q77DRAFT_144986 [Trametes polyzona]|nr:hypothetical protein C8Q77DRAFT_144986 [Trametes polyzona]
MASHSRGMRTAVGGGRDLRQTGCMTSQPCAVRVPREHSAQDAPFEVSAVLCDGSMQGVEGGKAGGVGVDDCKPPRPPLDPHVLYDVYFVRQAVCTRRYMERLRSSYQRTGTSIRPLRCLRTDPPCLRARVVGRCGRRDVRFAGHEGALVRRRSCSGANPLWVRRSPGVCSSVLRAAAQVSGDDAVRVHANQRVRTDTAVPSTGSTVSHPTRGHRVGSATGACASTSPAVGRRCAHARPSAQQAPFSRTSPARRTAPGNVAVTAGTQRTVTVVCTYAQASVPSMYALAFRTDEEIYFSRLPTTYCITSLLPPLSSTASARSNCPHVQHRRAFVESADRATIRARQMLRRGRVQYLHRSQSAVDEGPHPGGHTPVQRCTSRQDSPPGWRCRGKLAGRQHGCQRAMAPQRRPVQQEGQHTGVECMTGPVLPVDARTD